MARVCVALRSFLAAVLSRFRFLLFLLPLFTRFILSIELRFDLLSLVSPLVSPLSPSLFFLCRKLMLLKEDARRAREGGMRPAKDEVDLRGFVLCVSEKMDVSETSYAQERSWY